MDVTKLFDFYWNDPEFLKCRIKEQDKYIEVTEHKIGISDERKAELITTAIRVKLTFMERLQKLELNENNRPR